MSAAAAASTGQPHPNARADDAATVASVVHALADAVTPANARYLEAQSSRGQGSRGGHQSADSVVAAAVSWPAPLAGAAAAPDAASSRSSFSHHERPADHASSLLHRRLWAPRALELRHDLRGAPRIFLAGQGARQTCDEGTPRLRPPPAQGSDGVSQAAHTSPAALRAAVGRVPGGMPAPQRTVSAAGL